MKFRTTAKTLIPAIAAGLLALPVAAQEASDTATAEAAPETKVQVFGEYQDWRLLCDQTGEVIDNCRMIQPAFNEAGNQVSQVELRALTTGENVAILIVGAPLETFLPAGVRMSIDGGPEQALAFQFCAPAGCFATINLSEAALDLFIKGGKATVKLVPYANRSNEVVAEFSLSGFTAAFEQLEVQVGADN